MRSMVGLLAAVAILVAMPFTASAQGLPFTQGAGSIVSALPGLPSFFPSKSGCGAPKSPIGPPVVYFGYVGDFGKTSFSATAQNGPTLGLLQSAKQSYDISTGWLAASLPITLGDFGLAQVSASWALPTSARSEEEYDFGGTPTQREWSAKIQWYTFEGLGAIPVYGSTFFVGGYRYDSFATTFTDPGDVLGGIPSVASDEADVNSSLHIPFVGLLFTKSVSNVTWAFGAVGFPTLFGNVKYKEAINQTTQRFLDVSGDVNGGYFLELFCEYALKAFGGTFGGYAKFSTVQATSTVTNWNLDVPALASESAEVNLGLHRNVFNIGGRASIDFDLPF